MLKNKPPKRLTSVDLATTSLYVDILEGKYPPGSFLRLNEVAEQLGMSMMPVREAIRELSTLGIIENLPHRGAQVRHLSLEDLCETYRGRLYLETLALRLGAPLFTPEQEMRATEANERRIHAVENGSTLEIVTTHEQFHFELYNACGNPWIVKALLPGWRNAERYRSYSMRNPEVRKQLDSEHALLLQAMADRDAVQAVTLIHQHLTSAANAVAHELEGKNILDDLPTVEELLSIAPHRYVANH